MFNEGTTNPEEIPATDFVDKLKEGPITLLELSKEVNPEEIQKRFPNKTIVVCDAYVSGAEEHEKSGQGFRIGRIVNLDHHAPTPEMRRRVSSANLAIDQVKEHGVVPNDVVVVVNHTDCDSVLSSAIMRGIVPPDEKFGEAAIAADHTGAENEIADLLQSIEDKRDMEFSLRNLQLLLDGKSIEPKARELLEKRLQDREKIRGMIEEGRFRQEGGVVYAEISENIDGGLLPGLLPDAQVILIMMPHPKIPNKNAVKIRLGAAAPDGLDLNMIGISDFDLNFGGRWNAGANKRGGGTDLSVEEYARKLNEHVQASIA